MFGLDAVLLVLSLAVCIPLVVFVAQVAFGLVSLRGATRADASAPGSFSVAVLVPAHNEGSGLVPTLADIRSQLSAQDRVLVVADNCTDDTAEQARSAGADVIERQDPDRRGKGYALDHGIRHLAQSPPDVVIICDADCRLSARSIPQIARLVMQESAPVQALYLMLAPETGASRSIGVSLFAWRIRNWIRPLGAATLGMPCQLMGSGMGFPWKDIQTAELANGRLAEDLELGLELALRGNPPVFCPDAIVTSVLAASSEGENTQRERWKGGHLSSIRRWTVPFLVAAVVRRDLRLLGMLLDLLVPPLVLLVGLAGVSWFVLALAAVLGASKLGLILLTAAGTGLAAALVAAWLVAGRDVLPPRQLAALPGYLAANSRVIAKLLAGRGPSSWTRTDRSPGAGRAGEG